MNWRGLWAVVALAVVLFGIGIALGQGGPARTAVAAPMAAELTSTSTPAAILRIIDAEGRDHFILAGSILRVERAAFPERSTWVTLAGQGWNPVVTVSGETGAVAAAWAYAAGLRVNPVAVGVPPGAANPVTGGAP